VAEPATPLSNMPQMSIHAYMYVYTNIHVRMCTCIHTYACAYVDIYMCMYVCCICMLRHNASSHILPTGYIYVYVCMYVYVFIYICKCMYRCICMFRHNISSRILPTERKERKKDCTKNIYFLLLQIVRAACVETQHVESHTANRKKKGKKECTGKKLKIKICIWFGLLVRVLRH